MDFPEEQLTAAVVEQIRVEMLERGMHQKDLSEAAGIERATMNRYLMGRRTIPLPTLVRVARSFGMGPSALLGRAEARMLSQQSASADQVSP